MLLLSITLCIYLPLSRTTQHNTTAASTVWVLLLTFLVVDLSSIPLHFFEPSSFGSLSLRYVSASSSAMSTSKSSLLGTIGIGQTRYYSGDEANSKKKCTVLRTRAVLAVEMVQSRRRMATRTFVQVSLHSVHDEEENRTHKPPCAGHPDDTNTPTVGRPSSSSVPFV